MSSPEITHILCFVFPTQWPGHQALPFWLWCFFIPPPPFPHQGQFGMFLCILTSHEPGPVFIPLPLFLPASSVRCINKLFWKEHCCAFRNWRWLNNVHQAVVSSCRSNATYILCFFSHVTAFYADFYHRNWMRATVLGPDLTLTPCSAVRIGSFLLICPWYNTSWWLYKWQL